MKTSHSHRKVSGLLFAALFPLWLPPGQLWAEEKGFWKVQEIAGEEYIALEQIQTFYRFDKSTRNESSLTLENPKIAMNLEIGSTECLLNQVKVVLAKPVVDYENAAYISSEDLSGLLDPMLRPNHIKGAGDFRTVILDPAHGAADPGITNELGTEGEFAFKIAKLVKTQLEAKGFTVVLTRQEEQDASPEERRNLANAVDDDAIFIGISFNSGPEDARGIQTLPVARGESVIASDPFGSASVALSTAIHGSVMRRLGKNSSDGGIKRAEPEMFSGIRHPAVLVNAGYLTHPYEARLIANENYQAAVALGIAEGLGKYRFAVTKSAPEFAPFEPETR